jgi:hypothetical protein
VKPGLELAGCEGDAAELEPARDPAAPDPAALALARATGPEPLGDAGRCAVQAAASRTRTTSQVTASVPVKRREASGEGPGIREFDLGSGCTAGT